MDFEERFRKLFPDTEDLEGFKKVVLWMQVKGKSLEGQEKLEFIVSMYEKVKESFDNKSIQEKAKLLREVMDRFEPNAAVECNKMIQDYETHPYFGEETNQKYTFEESGFLCRLQRRPEAWFGSVSTYRNDLLEHCEELTSGPRFAGIHGGVVSVDNSKVGISFGQRTDIFSASEMIESAFVREVNETDKKYQNFESAREKTRELAQELRLFLESLPE